MDFDRASDSELVAAARAESSPTADRCLEALYARHYRRVAHWCLQFCRNRDEATDLAQEVFLRVHSRLDSFRMESRFTTWLYTVARSVAINRGIQAQRRRETFKHPDPGTEPIDPAPAPVESLQEEEAAERLRQFVVAELDPLEAKILYLHHVDGLTLPAITKLLSLQNRSGAKAFVVSGMRKLRRNFNAGPDQDRRARENR